MYEIYVSDYGTIKGNNFKEVPIKVFFGKLNVLINKLEYKIDDNYKLTFNYGAKVKNIKEDSYAINYNNKTYYLMIDKNLKYYSKLKQELEKLCNLSKDNDYLIETYNSFEINNGNKDINAYNLLINKLYKKIRKDRIINFFVLLNGYFGFGIGILLCFLNANLFPIALIDALFSFSFFVSEVLDFNLTNDYIKKIKVSSILKRKIKEYGKRIALSKKHNLSNINEHNENINIYEVTIKNYIKNILNNVNNLNKDDRYRLLVDLKKIIEDYTNNINNFNEEANNISNLEYYKNKVYKNTLDSLVDIEFEISKLLKKQNQYKFNIEDSENLMKQINTSIEESNASENRMTLSL